MNDYDYEPNLDSYEVSQRGANAHMREQELLDQEIWNWEFQEWLERDS